MVTVEWALGLLAAVLFAAVATVLGILGGWLVPLAWAMGMAQAWAWLCLYWARHW